ncbi:MAG: GNAT family N-acetyltransferase [Clostridia bacterium]|nr:GNAT family N-acetyltransferase [Clostridia bacterium]
MSDSFKVCRVGEDRYDELMQMMDLSFGFVETDSVPFLQLLPKLYKKQYAPWQNNMCVLEKGRLRSAIGIYYQQMDVCGELLKVGGIGNVCVHPDARGKGYMQKALGAVVEEMKHNDTDFSFLDGHRQRYAYFGYEGVGAMVCIGVDVRNIRHVFGAAYQPEMEIVPIEENDAETQLLVRINDSFPVHSVRDPNSVVDLLHSWNNTAYKLRKNGETVGYFVLSRDDVNVPEFRMVSPEYIPEAVAAIVLPRSQMRANFSFPACYTDYYDYLSSVGSTISVNASLRISVYNYRRTLSAFFRAKALETVMPDCEATVLVHGIRADENLKIRVKNNVPEVALCDDPPDIELGHLEAALFFFGFRSPARQRVPALCPCLPIPAFLLSPDHV